MDRVYKLQAPSDEEKGSWIEALNVCMKYVQGLNIESENFGSSSNIVEGEQKQFFMLQPVNFC